MCAVIGCDTTHGVSVVNDSRFHCSDTVLQQPDGDVESHHISIYLLEYTNTAGQDMSSNQNFESGLRTTLADSVVHQPARQQFRSGIVCRWHQYANCLVRTSVLSWLVLSTS